MVTSLPKTFSAADDLLERLYETQISSCSLSIGIVPSSYVSLKFLLSNCANYCDKSLIVTNNIFALVLASWHRAAETLGIF